MLYPYRASSSKNQVRCSSACSCPRHGAPTTPPSDRRPRRVSGPPRTDRRHDDPGSFLQQQERAVEAPGGDLGREGPRFVPVERLEVDGTTHVAWDEAVDCSLDLGPLALAAVVARGTVIRSSSTPARSPSRLVAWEGTTAGRLVRRRHRVTGQVRVSAAPADAGADLVRVTVAVENTTATVGPGVAGTGRWATPCWLCTSWWPRTTPPSSPSISRDSAAPAAGACRSEGIYPAPVRDDLVLASPIILYDHPEAAPESPGDLYDATEIDEILALRVLTLTDEEKSEAPGTDARAARSSTDATAFPPRRGRSCTAPSDPSTSRRRARPRGGGGRGGPPLFRGGTRWPTPPSIPSPTRCRSEG